jgi:catechol 2,3-dioxygenase-like lactoylglutathione lyase family enzyme
MKRVTGIGGIFIKSADPQRLRDWYRKHLGVEVEEWGGCAFRWKSPDNPEGTGTTVWSVFEAASNYFAPGNAPFMVNYRVADVNALVAALRAEGCQVMDKVDESEFGKFGWVVDPDGNKIELWEPPAGQ